MVSILPEEEAKKKMDWLNTWVVCLSEKGSWRYKVIQRKGHEVAGWYNFKLFAIMKAKKMNRDMRKNPLSCAYFVWEPK